MKTRRDRALILTVAAVLLLAGAVLTPRPALGAGSCRLLDAFPATGQTTCWNSAGTGIACAGTGQDGDIQAGATLRYRDNGNGTITDLNTLLTWEKKSDDGSIHDKDTLYTWVNALGTFIPMLNNRCADETTDCTAGGDAACTGIGNGRCGFAGRRDWRLANGRELPSIINYENVNPAVSSAFNTGCVPTCTVLTCSCTASFYWSSSTFANGPSNAWSVDFFAGSVSGGGKSSLFLVRAVRGGCVN